MYELKTARREVAILAEKEIEYAKQAHNRSKEIKSLRERYCLLLLFFFNFLPS